MTITGQLANKTLSEAIEILDKDKSVTYRIFRPHSKNLITDDFVANRLTIYVDINEQVTQYIWG